MKIQITPLTPPQSLVSHAIEASAASIWEGEAPILPQVSVTPVAAAEPVAKPVAQQPRGLVRYWRKAGGGSLLVSLLVHVVILAVAYYMVQTIVQPEKKVDFLPGGGSKAGQEASQALAHQVQQKKRNALNQKTPMKKVVSTSLNSAIALSDLPMDTLDMPEMGSTMGGMAGSGGFGSKGAGGGSGSGVGIGGAKGFGPPTFFGRAGGDAGLAGSFYDLKQDSERKPTGYGKGDYVEIVQKAAAAEFSESSMKGYYKARQQMSFTYLLVPTNMQAEEGPKCFNVQNEVEPSGWFVHYGGTVVPPKSGVWRFVGFFDDLLIVYVNNKPVLDGSWVPMSGSNDKEIRGDFGGPAIAGGKTAYCGKWIKLSDPFKLDIVVGERPGGKVGGLLLVQNQADSYKMRDDGTPILPLFTMARPEASDLSRIRKDPFADRVGVDMHPPVFEARRSLSDGGRSRGLGLLPLR